MEGVNRAIPDDIYSTFLHILVQLLVLGHLGFQTLIQHLSSINLYGCNPVVFITKQTTLIQSKRHLWRIRLNKCVLCHLLNILSNLCSDYLYTVYRGSLYCKVSGSQPKTVVWFPAEVRIFVYADNSSWVPHSKGTYFQVPHRVWCSDNRQNSH
jgi:hypothetical protein